VTNAGTGCRKTWIHFDIILIAGLLKLKQGGDPFAKFAKEFEDLVADLNAQGDAEQVPRMLFNFV